MGCDSDFYTSAGAGWICHQEQVLWKNVWPSQLPPRKLRASLPGNEVFIDRPTVDSYFCLLTVGLFQSLHLRFRAVPLRFNVELLGVHDMKPENRK